MTALVCTALSISCDSDQKVVEEVLETFTSGAVLRTRPATVEAEYDIFRTENSFSIVIEQQDKSNGELIDRVDFTIDYVDANPQNGDVSVAGVPYPALNLTAADFTTNDRGLPEATFSDNMQSALDLLGLDLTDVLPGDAIQLNLELFFTDGRTFKADDAAVTVTGGSFFSSPFLYRTLIDDGIEFDYEVTTSDELDLSEGALNEDYEVSISIDDAAEGALLETLNVYRTLRDLTIGEDGTDLSEEEALFETFAIADLDLEDGARVLEKAYTIAELLGDTVTLADLSVGDDIQLRYEIVTADGRIITTSENGTEYFYSIATSECVALDADGPFPGEYTLNLTDSYGDGWNGGFLNIFLDEAAIEGAPFSVETGDSASFTFTIPEGASSISVIYTSGDWDDENSFEIIDPNGKKAAIGGPFPRTNGTGPFDYEINLKVCE